MLPVFVLLLGSMAAAPPAVIPQPAVQVAPGIALPKTGTVWVLQSLKGNPALNPLVEHETTLEKYATVSPAWGAAKPAGTIRISYGQASSQLENGEISFLARTYDAHERRRDTTAFAPADYYQLVRLEAHHRHREVHALDRGRVPGKSWRIDQVVETTVTQFPGTSWLRIVPAQPLPPGEYALEAKMPSRDSYSAKIWDFGISPPVVRK